MERRREIGQCGEDFAVHYLQEQGWSILDRNWRCAAGELDIVACPPDLPGTVVFCEVKTRRGEGFGPPLEAITTTKVAKLREVALHWLKAHDARARHLRFDGIGILLAPSAAPQLVHRQGIGA